MVKMIVPILLLLLRGLVIISAYRLSRNVWPQHYSLKLHPNMEEDTFQGEATITIYTNNNEEKIILHSNGLNITTVLINQLPGDIAIEDHGKISVRFNDSSMFQPGEHVIYFKYNGILQEQNGLLKASYKYKNQTGYLVVNEFEPIYARKAFPCFDEPFFKAHFNIRLVTPNDSYIAVSNMPEISHYPGSDGIIYNFATSVRMSTYLLSLAITDYQYYEDVLEYSNKKIPIRVYTYNASKENNNYAIEGAKIAIQFYSNYTGIEYSLPKLDMIEYNKGKITATETWGLIQFKEGLLTKNLELFDEWQCYMVIFHELAHFWFGNLVTNDWWNDLWLQEGFASFMANKLMSLHDKTLNHSPINMMELFEYEVPVGTLQLVNYLSTTEYIEKRFDNVVYKKGQSLLISLEAVVGKEKFQDVLKIFLKTYAYGTATTNNLISVFESHVLNMNVRSFLESYAYQTGFPFINIEEIDGDYVITQIQDDIFRNKWTIPISYSCENNFTNLVWFDKDAESVTVTCPNESKLILVNTVKQPGIYVVNYTETMWSNLIDNLNELPDAELNMFTENAEVLYVSKRINCNVIIQIVENMKYKSLYTIFKGVRRVARDIACFSTEYQMLMEYLRQKFDNSETYLQHFSAECRTKGNWTIDKADYHLRQCAQWITNNLVNYIERE